MKVRELFALAIRILGLIGLAHLFHSVLRDIYYALPGLGWSYYVTKAIYAVAGFYCLRGAPQVVALAYGNETESREPKPPTF